MSVMSDSYKPQVMRLAVPAFRYALGRMSYVTGEVADCIRDCMHILAGADLKLMVKEIDQALESGRTGMEMDEKAWKDLRDDITSELKVREADVAHLLKLGCFPKRN